MADPAATVFDLSYLGAIRVSGADARVFLQGQLTTDVDKLTADHHLLAAYCSPQGRVLALGQLVKLDDDCVWVLPLERIDAVIKRLRLFVLNAAVEINDASAELSIIGVHAVSMEALKTNRDWAFLTTAAAAGSVANAPGIQALRLGDEARFLLVCDTAAEVVATAQASAADWRLLEIRSGRPAVFDVTADQFVPQMIDLHRLAAVDFEKGCYVGQEVVARAQYRGSLKRGLFRIAAAAGSQLAPGDPLRDDNGRLVGQVVDAIAGPEWLEGLAVLTRTDTPEALVIVGPTKQTAVNASILNRSAD